MTARTASKPLEITTRTSILLPALLLFISGGAALVYQVLWIKQLSLVVGVEVYAITTGISAFFAGLALGGLLFGRLADRGSVPPISNAGSPTKANGSAQASRPMRASSQAKGSAAVPSASVAPTPKTATSNSRPAYSSNGREVPKTFTWLR